MNAEVFIMQYVRPFMAESLDTGDLNSYGPWLKKKKIKSTINIQVGLNKQVYNQMNNEKNGTIGF